MRSAVQSKTGDQGTVGGYRGREGHRTEERSLDYLLGRVRLWRCEPARVDSVVQRVFQEIEAARNATLTQEGMARVRDILLKELDQRSQDNRYVLNDIARLYEEGDAANLARVNQEPANIAALSAEVIQQSAMRYLDTANYVQVTLTPETR